jgi:hypothetical protein
MTKNGIAVGLVLMILALGILTVPAHLGRSLAPGAVSSPGLPGGSAGVLRTALAPAAPHPLTSFPRTVLIETFTGVWCPNCPAETQSLYQYDANTSHSVLNIAELHVCEFAPPRACGDNYVPPDGTSNSRTTFYNVCGGVPDVFFDGQHDVCGATQNTTQMGGQYGQLLAKALQYPGNVSISQSASILLGNVTASVNVTAGVSGTYNAVSYLLEFIGKTGLNYDPEPHSVGNAVRETLYNHPVTLTAGQTTEITEKGRLNSSWNTHNLSVVSFLQDNTTKIVQNANMTAVSNMLTTVTANESSVTEGGTATVTVHVVNASSGLSISGATVSLSTTGGSLGATGGVTGSAGIFTTTFTAPTVSVPKPFVITAQVQASGYVDSSGAFAILVNPIVLSPVPTGLTVTPGTGQVTLNWTTPAAGGYGDTYYVYRSSSASGGYATIGTSITDQYVDSNLVTGQSYWYTVSADNSSGFSGNTSAAAATGVTAVPQGLPASVEWWLSIDSLNVTSPGTTSLPLFLPTGNFTYEFAPTSYAYVATPVTSLLHVAGASITVSAVFSPRYASLEGSVSPANALVTLNGATVNLTSGAFVEALPAGTYTLNVSASGYQSNSSTVTLTPGNLTTDSIALQRNGAGATTSGLSLGTTGILAIVGVAVVLGVVLVAVMMMPKKGMARRPPRARTGGPASPPPPNE